VSFYVYNNQSPEKNKIPAPADDGPGYTFYTNGATAGSAQRGCGVLPQVAEQE